MPKGKHDELLKEIRDRLKLAQDSEVENLNRASFIEDTEFENSEGEDMWDEQARKERTEMGRPCIGINKCQPIVRQILGEARQNKIRIKVKPVDSDGDPKVANIFDGLIRNIENVSSADKAYDMGLGFSVRGGFGYFRILTKYAAEDSFEQDIDIERITNPLSVYCDPAAEMFDRSDMEWAFILDTMNKDEFERTFEGSILHSGIEGGLGDDEKDWVGNETVQVAEYFRKKYIDDTIFKLDEGRTIKYSSIKKNNHAIVEEDIDGVKSKWLVIEDQKFAIIKERETKTVVVEWYKTNGIEILKGPKEFPSKYIPIVFVPGDEVWINGKQVLRSAIKWSKEPNKLYNWARSIAVETMAAAPRQPILLTPAQMESFEPMYAVANKKPMPYLLYNHDPTAPGPPQRLSGSVPDMGADREAMLSSDDIKSTSGYHDPSLGAKSNEISGVAIRQRKQQSDTGSFVFIDNWASAIEHCGRILVDMIPRVFDTERVVRLLNEDGSEQWEKINQEIHDTATGSIIKVNDVTIGKYDVIVSIGPAYKTQREEASERMEGVLSAVPNSAPIILPRLVKNLDWPEADDMAEEFKQLFSQPPPGQENPQGDLDTQGKQLSNEGKELMNAKRILEIQEKLNGSEERTKELIVEALQGLGLIPNA